MFEAAELGRKVSKEEFKAQMPELRAALLEAQRALRDSHVSVIVIVAGVEGVGRGEVVNRLNAWLDGRGVETHAFWDVSSEEQDHPPYWRYWRALPPRGNIGIFFSAWYAEPLRRRLSQDWQEARLDAELGRIQDLERMLAQDDTLIMKFWFHLSRKEQKNRLKKRFKDPSSRWYQRPGKATLSKDYNTFVGVAERVIRGTDCGLAPWYLIEAADARYRDLTVGRTLLHAIKEKLANKGRYMEEPSLVSHAPCLPEGEAARLTILDHVNLEARLEADDYSLRLGQAQARLRQLTWQAHEQQRACVVVFEGWDAAGKGGAIRRLTKGIDARLHRVVPIAAPTDEEKAHHYLWRFWRHIPEDGRMTLFDRSWYGRVLVERVESFARADQWQRAYHEINEFEQQLSEHGIVLIKFWLHIGEDEQLRRFREREQVPYKRHKITEEDWRNREQWPAYKAAVNEMVIRTSTEYAPWTLVPGNDKRLGRVTVLETVCERLHQALNPKAAH